MTASLAFEVDTTSQHPQSPGDQLDPMVRLYHGGPHVLRTSCAVEVAGTDQSATLSGQALGEFPSISCVEPQIEAPGWEGNVDARPQRQHLAELFESATVPVALHEHVVVVAERDGCRRLSRPGHQHADVFADLF